MVVVIKSKAFWTSASTFTNILHDVTTRNLQFHAILQRNFAKIDKNYAMKIKADDEGSRDFRQGNLMDVLSEFLNISLEYDN